MEGTLRTTGHAISADAYNDLTILAQFFKSSNGEQTPKFLLSDYAIKLKQM